MHTATQITITRAEGPSALCRKPQTFEGPDCWDAARTWLFGQSTTFPADGGYDKHDFMVTFANGETYEGRLDCKHHTCGDPDLNVANHIRGYQEFYAGTRRPAYMSQEHWDRFVRFNGDSHENEAAKDFLANYEVPR